MTMKLKKSLITKYIDLETEYMKDNIDVKEVVRKQKELVGKLDNIELMLLGVLSEVKMERDVEFTQIFKALEALGYELE